MHQANNFVIEDDAKLLQKYSVITMQSLSNFFHDIRRCFTYFKGLAQDLLSYRLIRGFWWSKVKFT